MDPRRPLILYTNHLGPGTGTGGVVYRVALALRARGYPVEVVAQVVDTAPAGVPVRSPRDAVPNGLRVAFDRSAGADVVRASGGVHAAWTAVGADTPWRRLRARFGAELQAERDEARAFAGAQRVVANAERVVRELRLFHGLGPDRVRLVRTGVELDRFRPDEARRREARAAFGSRGRVAAFVGHSWRRKGLDVALAAFARVAEPADQLWVVGSDAHAARWRSSVRDPRVSFLGAADPAAWLPGADALLAPSRYDAASNVVIEALACGTPPVVSLADGSSEVVSDRRLCVADPRSVQGFAAGLRLAWEDAGLRGRCRSDGERWPVSRMVDGLVGVLAEVHGERGGDAGTA